MKQQTPLSSDHHLFFTVMSARTKFSSRWKQFVMDTGIHGLNTVFTSNHVKCVRFVYLVGLLSSLSVLGYYFSERISHYFTYDLTTTKFAQMNGAPMPSLQICHDNVFDYRKIIDKDTFYVKNTFFTNYSILSPEARKLVDQSKRNNLTNQIRLEKFLERTAFDISELIKRCQIRDRVNPRISCLDDIHPEMSSYGEGLGVCYRLTLQNKTDIRQLRLTLNVNKQAAWSVNPKILIKMSSIFGDRFSNEVLKFGEVTRARAFISRVIKSRRLGQPWNTKDCVRFGHDLQLYEHYTQENCAWECVARQVFPEIGCHLPGLRSFNAQMPGCNHSTVQTNHEAVMRKKSGCLVSCPRSCYDWLYQMTYVPRAPGKAPSIAFYMDSTMFENIKQFPLYSLESLLAELGGMVSLFVGGSLLTLFHLVQHLFMESLHLLIRSVQSG